MQGQAKWEQVGLWGRLISVSLGLGLMSAQLRAMAPIDQLDVGCRTLLSQVTLSQPSAGARFLKPEQAAVAGTLARRQLRQIERVEHLASSPVYGLTSDQARQYQWPERALHEFRQLLHWEQPFGVFYDPQRDVTQFYALGHPDRVRSIRLRLFDSHVSSPSAGLIEDVELEHLAGVNQGLAWFAERPGQLEGLWYDYLYEAQPGARSDFGELAPNLYPVLDPTALFSAGDRARIYYPPLTPTESPLSRRASAAPIVTLELGLRDLVTADIPRDLRGSALALLESPFLRKLTEPFSALELLPVRNYESLDLFASQSGARPDTLYFHYWGYMPTSLGIALDVGGPEALAYLSQRLAARGQVLIKDEVLQHTANKQGHSQASLNIFHFALPNSYRTDGCDRTGCGNTTNLDWGNHFTKLMLQMVIHDLLVLGWGGHRYDLMGAIPRQTAQELTDLAARHRCLMTGEPYGCPYHDSFWHTEYDTLRNAGLWDHHYRRELRRAIREQQHASEIFKWLGGGSYFTWVDQASDRTAILETHDGETLAHYFAGNLDQVTFATTLQLFSQGDVTLTLSQILGLEHPHLDNTPLDLRSLSEQQYQQAHRVLHFVRIRQQLSGFFAHPYLDPQDPSDYVELSEQGHNSGYIHLKKPAPSVTDDEGQQVVLVFNNSDNSTLPRLLGFERKKHIHLPPGDWYVAGSSRAGKLHQSRQVLRGKVYLEPFTALWLVKKPL